MEHRHLLPNEIDLLVDGEAGFGVAPLLAHVERCSACRSELEQAKAFVRTLERLPHISPSPLFAERVMSEVQVFEPWHVAAFDTVRRWIPSSSSARVAAAAAAVAVAAVLSVSALWLAVRAETLRFFFNIAAERGRVAFFDAVGSAVAGLFGEAALDALGSSGSRVMIGVTGFILLVALAALGLRALANASRRQRA